MPTSQGKDRGKLLVAVSGIQTELARLGQLVFSFDMDEDDLDSHKNGKSQGSRPLTSRPPSDIASGAGPPSSIDQAFSQLLDTSSDPLAQGLLGHPSELLNHEQELNQLAQSYYPLLNDTDTLILPPVAHDDLLLAVDRGGKFENPATHFPPPVEPSWLTHYASGGFSEVSNVDTGEVEMTISEEEKRRRNTAASAKFRMKKKERRVELERSISHLKGRAEELESEVTNLHRENNLLKEIVLLKASQHAAAQRQLVQRHLIQNVGIDLILGVGGQGSASSSAISSSISKETTVPEETSSNDSGPRK